MSDAKKAVKHVPLHPVRGQASNPCIYYPERTCVVACSPSCRWHPDHQPSTWRPRKFA